MYRHMVDDDNPVNANFIYRHTAFPNSSELYSQGKITAYRGDIRLYHGNSV